MSIYHTISRICIVLLHGEGQKRPARADASRMQDVCTYREMAPAPPGPTPAKGSLLSNTGYTQPQLSVLVYGLLNCDVQLLCDSDGEASIAPAGGGYLILFLCSRSITTASTSLRPSFLPSNPAPQADTLCYIRNGGVCFSIRLVIDCFARISVRSMPSVRNDLTSASYAAFPTRRVAIPPPDV